MVRLLILDGPGKGISHKLKDITTKIGRSAYCDIHLVARGVSRIHASIHKVGDNYVIRDEMSLNGVFVNGKKIDQKTLCKGDRLSIGEVTMVFEPDFDLKVSDKCDDSILITSSHDSIETQRITKLLDPAGVVTFDDRYIRHEQELAIAHSRLKTLYDVSTIISCVLDENELVNKILNLVIDSFSAARGFIMYPDEKSGDLVPAAVYKGKGQKADITVDSNVLDRLVKEKKGVLGINESDPVVPESQPNSMMGAPFLRHGKLLAIIYVDVPTSIKQYTEEDLKLLVAIANQASAAIENARLFTKTRQENIQLRERLQHDLSIIGRSPQMRAIMDQVRKVAVSDSTIILRGETGTGKELIAHAIHKASRRSTGPFVPVNCTAIGEHLLESELFGHERGAFTGAYKTKLGKFELADGGTIFLDEIGEISPSIQLKLLRAIEEKRFTRVGGVRFLSVDVRIIAATNRDLEAAVRNGNFREDLFYRLCVIPITLPPLRQRRDDIPDLANHFLKKYCLELGKNIKGITDEAMSILIDYDWPGNIRELKNIIERCVVLVERNWIDVDDIPVSLSRCGTFTTPQNTEDMGFSLHDIVRNTEKALVKKVLELTNRKKSAAAKLLKISRPTLDKKIQEYGL